MILYFSPARADLQYPLHAVTRFAVAFILM